jgi:lysozyme family protein
MAIFDEAFDITMGHEGGYSNDPHDAGGETYRGISRRYHPTWSGWNVIDDTKPNIDNDELDPYVREFYEAHYWDRLRLDDFWSQSIANEMFDTAVNMGVRRAGKFLQECLNYLNRNESLFSDLVVDGIIGPASIDALNEISEQDGDILLTMLNVCQGRHYMEYMKKSPTQERYARGWFTRVIVIKG